MKNKIIELVGTNSWVMIKNSVEKSIKGERIFHATDYKPILRKRKELMKLLPNLTIMNRREEKIFIMAKSMKEEDLKRLRKELTNSSE